MANSEANAAGTHRQSVFQPVAIKMDQPSSQNAAIAAVTPTIPIPLPAPVNNRPQDVAISAPTVPRSEPNVTKPTPSSAIVTTPRKSIESVDSSNGTNNDNSNDTQTTTAAQMKAQKRKSSPTPKEPTKKRRGKPPKAAKQEKANDASPEKGVSSPTGIFSSTKLKRLI